MYLEFEDLLQCITRGLGIFVWSINGRLKVSTLKSFQAGEEYVLFVMATDNNIDSIGIRTSCGSMSYCGAKGQDYPDSRNMGYPFVNPVYYNGKPVSLAICFGKFRLDSQIQLCL